MFVLCVYTVSQNARRRSRASRYFSKSFVVNSGNLRPATKDFSKYPKRASSMVRPGRSFFRESLVSPKLLLKDARQGNSSSKIASNQNCLILENSEGNPINWDPNKRYKWVIDQKGMLVQPRDQDSIVCQNLVIGCKKSI